eukprot:CAMPEP_0202885358 /NCGR_PEP_ID=MMETSP1391-20130828/41622_1 /ASSEMBLY_ACC=CAM_ASM_000867 /TAXON_ID=1034604 /ORGANISM="Chlamydomonas leiostraca, Strain SAG 11-49" /LENGTH=38 /DNA_ID= /DNA_START= /DNA_END= /DNA_ORIENTATION=
MTHFCRSRDPMVASPVAPPMKISTCVMWKGCGLDSGLR